MIFLFSLLTTNLWEAAVIACVAWAVLKLARSANATTRYLVWTCALAATVILPLATMFFIPKGEQKSETATSTAATLPAGHSRSSSALPMSLALHHSQADPFSTALHADEKLSQPSSQRVFVIPQSFVWAILGVWSVLGLLQLTRFIFALFALERLKHNATPLPIDYRQGLHAWNREQGRSDVRLCVSDEIMVPVAVGLFDAMILIPQALLEQMRNDDVDRILLHELTHLRRKDDWIHAFQRLATALCFFNPAMAFIARQMDLEREVSCDDSVLERDRMQAVPYATCLTKMAEIVAWPYRPLAAPGVFDTRRSLSIRVERLLNSARDNRTRIAAAPALTAILAMSAAGVAGAAVSSQFSFALPSWCPGVQSTTDTYAQTRVGTPIHIAIHEHVHAQTHAQVRVQTRALVRVRSAVRAAYGYVAVNTLPAAKAKPKPAASVRPGDDYIQELANEGYRGLSIDELVELRAVGVDGEYIRAIEAAGYSHPSTRELTQLRATGVTPATIAELRSRLGSLSLRDIAQLHAVGVTGDYIDSLARAGFPGLQAREVMEMRALGMTPAVIAELRGRLPSATLRQIVHLHAVGVDSAYIDSLAGAGYAGLSAEQLLQLKALGVDSDYIKSALAHGFHNLTVRQLIEMKATGLL